METSLQHSKHVTSREDTGKATLFLQKPSFSLVGDYGPPDPEFPVTPSPPPARGKQLVFLQLL